MLSITIRSVLEALKGVGDSEIIIVDNSDADIYNLISKQKSSPLSLHYIKQDKLKIIRQDFPCFFTAAMTGFREAQGEYIFHTDSHMLIGHNTFADLIGFMDKSDENVGLAYCPIGWCGQHENNARHEMRNDTDNIYAGWGKKYSSPKKITWNFGSWIARKEWFLETHGGYGFFERNKVSWGGGQFYTALKSWLLGFENWAVPTDPIYHIGPFSAELQRKTGYNYRVYAKSGETKLGIGILASFYALAGEDGKEFAKKAEIGFKKHHGITVDNDWNEARDLAKEDWLWLDKNKVISLRQFWEGRLWEK
jgi:hypothetical protein